MSLLKRIFCLVSNVFQIVFCQFGLICLVDEFFIWDCLVWFCYGVSSRILVIDGSYDGTHKLSTDISDLIYDWNN